MPTPKVYSQQRKVKPAKQRPWRDVKEKMISERFTYLRKVNFENQLQRSDVEMKEEAEAYALASVQSASRQAIAQELGRED